MKLFIDSANINEIKTAASWGIIDGVTTNPSLIAKEGRNFKEVVLEITQIMDGPISAEVVSVNAEGMLKEAHELAKWHKNIVIKLPMTAEGLKACKELSAKKIKTNVTLVFSATQILAAAKTGATYISPFVGRLDDTGEDGIKLIEEGVKIIKNYNFESQILSASIRSVEHVKKSALAGSQVATVPFKVLEAMLKHPLTDAGIEKFLKDWESVPR